MLPPPFVWRNMLVGIAQVVTVGVHDQKWLVKLILAASIFKQRRAELIAGEAVTAKTSPIPVKVAIVRSVAKRPVECWTGIPRRAWIVRRDKTVPTFVGQHMDTRGRVSIIGIPPTVICLRRRNDTREGQDGQDSGKKMLRLGHRTLHRALP